MHLRGLELLKLNNVAHTIQQRVNTLFFEAHIPSNWKNKCQMESSLSFKTDVYITLLNYIVKERVKELLSNYFSSYHYDKIIYID
jgi:hypothetical protein